jgi:hypothetical protein
MHLLAQLLLLLSVSSPPQEIVMSFKKFVAASFLTCLASMPVTSSAEIVTFDFGSGGVFTGGTSSNSFGNSVVFTGSDGVTTVTVTAFGMTQGTTAFGLGGPYSIQTAAVTQTSNGLGACNRREFGAGILNTCNSITGAGGADNLGFDEFLLFAFNRPTDVTSTRLNPSESLPNALALADSDAVTYQFTNSISPVGQLFPNLLIGPKTAYPANVNDLPRDLLDTSTNKGPFFIVAAEPDDAGLVEDDTFRVKGLTGVVPLPGTLALLAIAGLAGFGVSRKRAA